ncbi:hypothetical protein HELRODRAFT_109869, partial [Helobdella robusta]|uniref:ubiquitinyl hydrolase 1 n=1 Tax=Helobdella robusta TaxID=6412 RepID=T1EEX0_HELRO
MKNENGNNDFNLSELHSLLPQIIKKSSNTSYHRHRDGRLEQTKLAGLPNDLGNSCYINSIVQCLNNCDLLVCSALTSKLEQNGIFCSSINVNNHSQDNSITEQLSCLIQSLWLGRCNLELSKKFKSSIGRIEKQFRGSTQQDAHEFLLWLLGYVKDELSKEKDFLNSNEKPAKNKLLKLTKPTQTNNVIDYLFRAYYTSTLNCLKCGHLSSTLDPFLTISLPISMPYITSVKVHVIVVYHSSCCTLDDCFNAFTQKEQLSEDNAWFCVHCGKRQRETTKNILISSYPNILVVHLKRFKHDSSRRTKLNTFVRFPIKNLNLSDYISDDSADDHTYDLFAVCNHYGSLTDGHYTAFCLNPLTKEWYHYNDLRVTKMTENEVVTTNAYILFY